MAQLSEYRLIDWTPVEDKSGMGLLSGFAKINGFGVKVLEGGVASPIRISIDEGRRTTVPQQEQAPIGPSTPQQQVIVEALEKVITAINQADVSEREKNEVKSLLRKLLGSKAAASVLGLARNPSPRSTSRDKNKLPGTRPSTTGRNPEVRNPSFIYRKPLLTRRSFSGGGYDA